MKFLSRGSGYELFLTRDEAVLALQKGQRQKGELGKDEAVSFERSANRGKPTSIDKDHSSTVGEGSATAVLRMRLAGSNRATRLVGFDELPGKSNYFLGNNPKKWCTNVPRYARVARRDVYPGVDVVYHGKQERLEYDFIVAPGADPRAIRIAFAGVLGMYVDVLGNLVLSTGNGEIRQHKPHVYQEVENGEKEITGRYVITEKHEVAFGVASYDAEKTLIIDPVLSYSTYLGGERDGSGQPHCR